MSVPDWTVPPAVVDGLTAPEELETLEIELLLEAVHRRYGFDFREYAQASLKRRLWRRMHAEGRHDRHPAPRPAAARTCVHGTALARSLDQRHRDVPRSVVLRSHCASTSFRAADVPVHAHLVCRLLHRRGGLLSRDPAEEEGLYDRTRIYATDINEQVLDTARAGVFPLDKMQQYTQNYIKAGGKREFSEYYVAAYDGARFSRSLTENIVFAQHNLVSDRAFNEFNVIVCRNVMIYFDKTLQDRVHRLFYESLSTFGTLALGRKESVAFTPYADSYEVVDAGGAHLPKDRVRCTRSS